MSLSVLLESESGKRKFQKGVALLLYFSPPNPKLSVLSICSSENNMSSGDSPRFG